MSNVNSDEAAVRSLLDELAGALHNRDAKAVVASFASTNVMFTLAPPLQSKTVNSKGQRGGGEEGVQAWFDAWSTPVGYEFTELAIFTSGEIAYSHSITHMAGRKRDGEEVDLWFRETYCFRKTGGNWEITHQHQSVPFYMDGSYRAATDLKP